MVDGKLVFKGKYRIDVRICPSLGNARQVHLRYPRVSALQAREIPKGPGKGHSI